MSESISKLIDLWNSDPKFRHELRSDPQGTLARCGISLTPEQAAAFHAIDWSLPDEELAARASCM